MELSDYDLLGIHQNASFRIIKNAYYDLSRIYHPDSNQVIMGMTKEDREIAFKKIKTAYENIKQTMNVNEIDLPDNDIKYEVDFVIKKIDNIDIKKNFNEQFNKEFEKVNLLENMDNPFSIHYKIPEENKRNLQDSQLILKDSTSYKSSNIHEFGINYIEDHSNNKFHDINKLGTFNINDKKIKDEIDLDFEFNLKKLKEIREKPIEFIESDLEFIQRQNIIKKNIEKSKIIIERNRNLQYIN